jgi:hypothetical protein
MDTAYLKVTQHRNEIGKIEQLTYELVGDSPYVHISRQMLDRYYDEPFPNAVQFGPYRLLIMEDYCAYDYIVYVRADKFGALRVAIYKATRVLDLFYRRMIVTLAVWNLAEFHEASIPSWRDIKIAKRFLKK